MMDVLVADDERISRVVIERTLKEEGYNVRSCKNGLEAYNLIKENIFRIAVIDWVMPEMDGITLCKKIRKLKSQRYIYVIIITSKSKKQDIVKALDAGADDYISKPFNRDEFLSRIKVGVRLIETHDKLIKSQRELIKLVREDSLTTLLNRRAFLDESLNDIERAVREQSNVSAIIIDLDNFKSINEKYTNQTGDKLLYEIARRLKNSCRPYDKLGRYAGEEFIVLLPNTEIDQASKIAKRIRSAIKDKPFLMDGSQIQLTACLGVSMLMPKSKMKDSQLDELIKKTEVALNRAKQQGSNKIAVYSE